MFLGFYKPATPACVMCRRWRAVWSPWITVVVHLWSYPMSYSTDLMPSCPLPLDGFHRQSGSPGVTTDSVRLPFQMICWGLFQPGEAGAKGHYNRYKSRIRKWSSISGPLCQRQNPLNHAVRDYEINVFLLFLRFWSMVTEMGANRRDCLQQGLE